MLGLLSSQLAFSAATTLAKKTFEFSVTSSLRGLSDVIRERFSHSQLLQDTQAELEAKVKMLCLPVDLLAHYATRGNTSLQEPLGVALGVLEEIEAFRQALVQHDVARAQDAASPDAATASAVQLCKRLRGLITRLDSLLPYLNLAISTAVLMSSGAGGSAPSISCSRLMAACWHLRANPLPGTAVFTLPEVSWHEAKQLTAAGPRMAEVFRRCSLTVLRTGGGGAADAVDLDGGASPLGTVCDAAAALGPAAFRFAFELVVQQDLDDGVYHEAGEAEGSLRVQVSDIVALEWETTQSLGQGENEYRPALVLHVWQGSAAGAAGAPAGEESAPGGGFLATPPASLSRHSSRTGSRRGGGTVARAEQGGAADAAAEGTGVVTPVSAARGGGAAGVGGSVRRYAVICNPRLPDEHGSDCSSDEEDEEEGLVRRGGDADSGSDSGSDGGDERAPITGGAAALQREWQLLGELEYLLRLCILECREQMPHQAVTDERIALHFQATSAPAHSHSGRSIAAAPPATGAPRDAALQRRASTVVRLRSAAAEAAHAISTGVEAMTQGVRQLSFTPGVGEAHSSTPQAGAAAPASASQPNNLSSKQPAGGGGGSSTRQTRSGPRGGGPGFGSPVH